MPSKAAIRRRIWWAHFPDPTQSRLSSFSEAVRRSATTFSCFVTTKQPFVISGSRPRPAVQSFEGYARFRLRKRRSGFWAIRVLPTQTRLSSFSEAVPRSATTFLCFASTKQPFVISGSRPEVACHWRSEPAIRAAAALSNLPPNQLTHLGRCVAVCLGNLGRFNQFVHHGILSNIRNQV